MATDRTVTWGFRALYGGLFVFLLAPIVVVVATAFGTSGTVSFPPGRLSLRWFGALADDPEWVAAVRNSLLVATSTSVVSLAVGVTAALGTDRLSGRLREFVTAVAVVPLLVPGVVLAVTLLTFFSQFSLQQTYVAVVLAHCLWAVPLTFSVMRAAFSRFDWQLYEAARDLGAPPRTAFRRVVVRNVRAGLFGAALIAFVISLQEFVMTLFLSGPDTRTVPVLAWNSLRGSLDPLVSVVSTLLVATALLVVAVVGADRIALDT